MVVVAGVLLAAKTWLVWATADIAPRQPIAYVYDGYAVIAADLDISVKTVELHKSNAMKKLGLKGRVDVIRYGVLHGWLYDT